MVGGKVVEIALQPERIWLNVQDRTYKKDFCGIYIERNEMSEKIECGDDIWWQGRYAYWTSDDRKYIEVKLERRSYSGVSEPEGYSIFDDAVITDDKTFW